MLISFFIHFVAVLILSSTRNDRFAVACEMTASQLRGRRERLTTKIQLDVNYDYHLPLGLRTLCIAMAELDPDEFQRWSDIYYKASTSLENREKNVDEAAELIEKVCYF